MKGAAAFLCLLLAGCGSAEPAAEAPIDPAIASVPAACEEKRFEGSMFTVCPFDAAAHEIELIDGRALRSLPKLEASLGERARRLRFAMNAGMYDEEGAPIGLFVTAGKEVKPVNRRTGAGNFHLLPNGIFAVGADGRLSVTRTDRFTLSAPRWATQSGPMLVIDGKLHPKFDADGKSQLIRNGVGVRDARTAYFVLSEDPVSFGRFARLFRDLLGCADALYLDGSVSSLWDAGAGRQDSFSELGPMIAVFNKQPPSAK